MQADKTCPIVEQYLSYLVTTKGRSQNTILEYRLGILQFFRFVARRKGIKYKDFKSVDILIIQFFKFFYSITIRHPSYMVTDNSH